ncbi:putative glycerate kinase [Oceaniovalibus guishaninsula JLT2003]|uniref:Putative glycerate kinase n=1 Tax=Oceaniovalibus guishaninsula JLT2003 TaxID=1231392 RepID=K2HDK0_9RHOB|nr:glycerate kinase [Oceaniovalibus guishaninsula]EKE45548.1 putative glycerate kinase [Oceaniovalibus guishaninsula JLT2003]
MRDPRAFLTALFDAAVRAADPARALAAHLPDRPEGRTVVIGAGKGAAQMAAAFEALWDGPLTGVVATRHGHAVPTDRIRVIEAAHPVPDVAGLSASRALVDAVTGLGRDDLVVALICGGGSSLLAAPAPGLTLADEQALNAVLLSSGAPIGVMNAVRKMCSTVKGGRLAALACPARVVSLIVSDVPGDDPAQVASGPTVPDAIRLADARAMIRARGLALPPAIMAHLDRAEEPPLPGDPVFARNEVRIVASARVSLEAAARTAEARGIRAVILSDAIEGEARDVALVHAAIAREAALRGRPFAPPVVMLSGGETTVTLGGQTGRGGRNGTFALAFALAVEGQGGIAALAADTDGIDGSEDNAGAFVDGGSAGRMRAAGVDPALCLAAHDSWAAHDAAGGLFVTGPTGTNVNDFRAILVRGMDDASA